jgi:multidrug efflux pump subunit AcrB
MPVAVSMLTAYDLSLFIEDSIFDVQFTMILTLLCHAIIFIFHREMKPTLIPSVVVPLFAHRTFAVKQFMGYTLNNLSLMRSLCDRFVWMTPLSSGKHHPARRWENPWRRR